MECHYSKLKIVGMTLLGIVMVAVSLFCALSSMADLFIKIVGWFGVFFFGACLIAIVLKFAKSGPGFIIDANGIDDRLSKWGFIPWAHIESVSIRVMNNNKFLCVAVKDPSVYSERRPRMQGMMKGANEALGFEMITLNFSILSPGLKEVWAYIEQHHPDKVL